MPYIIGLLALVVVAVGFTLMRNDTAETATETVAVTRETTEVAADTNEVDAPAAAVIPDGEHTTIVTYFTPKRDEYTLDVSLTTADGIITDAHILYSTGAESDPNAQRFEAAYQEVVLGQPIAELEVSRVGGASLTSAAFNEALENIRTGA